jgi:hypothetical protein
MRLGSVQVPAGVVRLSAVYQARVCSQGSNNSPGTRRSGHANLISPDDTTLHQNACTEADVARKRC